MLVLETFTMRFSRKTMMITNIWGLYSPNTYNNWGLHNEMCKSIKNCTTESALWVMVIKEHWEIRYRDINCDDGSINQDKPICITRSKDYASIICDALNKTDKEPNRDYYIKYRENYDIEDIRRGYYIDDKTHRKSP